MSDACNWIVFHAHPTRFAESEDEHPDFYGVFVCPVSRREPEVLLEEILANRKLFLAQILEHRTLKASVEWGMYEGLKTQVDQVGYGVALTKLQRGVVPQD